MAGPGTPAAAALQAIIVFRAAIRGEGAKARGMVIHKEEVATRGGGDNEVFYCSVVHTVVVLFLTVYVARVLVQRGWLWTAAVAAPTVCLRRRNLQCGTAVTGHVQLREQPRAVRIPLRTLS